MSFCFQLVFTNLSKATDLKVQCLMQHMASEDVTVVLAQLSVITVPLAATWPLVTLEPLWPTLSSAGPHSLALAPTHFSLNHN